MTLDIFNRHADKVAMANAAQLVNNIHTSFIAVGDRFTVTPIYHVFRMYAPHQGGTSVRTLFDAPYLSSPSAKRLAALSGSCSIQGNRAVLTVVNPDIHNPQDAEINVEGRRIANVRATILTSSDIHAHNTLDEPNAIQPAEKAVPSASPFVFQFPQASVTCLPVRLGLGCTSFIWVLILVRRRSTGWIASRGNPYHSPARMSWVS